MSLDLVDFALLYEIKIDIQMISKNFFTLPHGTLLRRHQFFITPYRTRKIDS